MCRRSPRAHAFSQLVSARSLDLARDSDWTEFRWNAPSVFYRHRALASHDIPYNFQLAFAYELGSPELLIFYSAFCRNGYRWRERSKHRRSEDLLFCVLGDVEDAEDHHATIASSKSALKSSAVAGRGDSFVTRCCGS